jgi:Putative auto-transporter adhesin, head GIN domain
MLQDVHANYFLLRERSLKLRTVKVKNAVFLLVFIILFTCDSESISDCFQTEGRIVQQEVEVSSFEKILVNRDIELILKQGAELKVIIETGKNLLNDVEAIVIDNQLQLTDYNTCNYVRDFGITKIYVTAANITEIRSSTQYDVSSDGVLNYNSLHLLSEDFIAPESFTVGDFRLDVNLTTLRFTSNNISSFYITGQTENLNIGFFAGSGRFEGENLIAQNVDVFHRGNNDMVVNPQQSLKGELRSTGDLISVNQPPIVEVQQFYTGQLIFEN